MSTKYTLTPEHEKQLSPWRDRWIANAMSTAPMTDDDRRICREAVSGMYAAVGLPAPRIVFVSSPFCGRFAAGFAAAIWHNRKTGLKNSATDAATRAATRAATYAATRAATSDATSDATYAATYAATDAATRAATRAATSDATDAATRAATRAATSDATSDATYAATSDATRAATYAATRAATRAATYAATRAATSDATSDATYAATRDATSDATSDATYDATSDATSDATRDATYAATYDATYDATEGKYWFKWATGAMRSLSKAYGLGDFGLSCANSAWRFWQGGNQWSSWASYLSFFRHVAKLPIDYSKWDHWEKLAVHSGPRFVHQEFCIICDRPEVLTVDAQNRPHNDSGPFCRWRDGAALYSVHGVRVPSYIIDHPDRLTAAVIEAEQNAEVRRVMIERYGESRYLMDAGATLVSQDKRGMLYRKEVAGDEPIVMVKVKNSTPEADGTFRHFFLRVDPQCRPLLEGNKFGAPQELTPLNAVASTFGKTGAEYDPRIET